MLTILRYLKYGINSLALLLNHSPHESVVSSMAEETVLSFWKYFVISRSFVILENKHGKVAIQFL